MAVLGTKFPALPLFPTTNLGTIMDIISKVLSEMLYLPAYLCSGGFLRIFIIIRSKKIGRVKDVDSFQSVYYCIFGAFIQSICAVMSIFGHHKTVTLESGWTWTTERPYFKRKTPKKRGSKKGQFFYRFSKISPLSCCTGPACSYKAIKSRNILAGNRVITCWKWRK